MCALDKWAGLELISSSSLTQSGRLVRQQERRSLGLSDTTLTVNHGIKSTTQSPTPQGQGSLACSVLAVYRGAWPPISFITLLSLMEQVSGGCDNTSHRIQPTRSPYAARHLVAPARALCLTLAPLSEPRSWRSPTARAGRR